MALFEIATFSALANVLLAARKLATDPDPLNRINTLADLAKDGKTLAAAVRGAGLDRLSAEMAKRAAALDRHLTHEGWAKSDAKAIFWQVAPTALADPAHLAAAALDPKTATNSMVAAILASDHARDFRQTAYAETYFRKVVSGTLAVMLADKTFVDSITPALWRQVLAGQGIQIDRLDAIKGDTAELLSRIDFLTRKVSQLEGAQEARAAGVSDAALFRLVRPIAEHIADRDEALLALQEAVQIARRVQEEGRHGSNLGDFVDAVLGRVRALSAKGDYQTAISELDAALSREEAESQARTHRLLTAAIDQHLLAFDAEGAAEKLARRVDLETPDPTARFDALRAEQDILYIHGRDKGLRLDIEVSIALARIGQTLATSADQRGTALNGLGNALQTLGDRETGTARLEEAVAAYRAALEERTRDRVPLDWAMTQTNLGNALSILGERETGTARLEEAVAAYRAALEERTRDRVPLGWASTRGNMTNLHLALFDKTGTAAELDHAQAALDDARAVFAEAQDSQFLAMADNVQAEIDARRR